MSKLSTCITDDLLCVCSHKTGSTHTGHVVTGNPIVLRLLELLLPLEATG